MLDEIINHVQSLQRQVEVRFYSNAPRFEGQFSHLANSEFILWVQFLSMRLAAINPRIDFNGLDNILSSEVSC